MRVMMIVKASKESEAGVLPSDELISKMMSFNEELVKAGVMLDGGGLTPSSQGARVRFDGAKRLVIDGPFTETKELIAGYWLLEVKSLAEAIEWCKRVPSPTDQPGEIGEIELRPLFEVTDFPDVSSETIAKATELEKQLKK